MPEQFELFLDSCQLNIHGVIYNKSEEDSMTLAVHGWLDNAASFVPLAEYLDLPNLIAIDLPGHGLSQHFSPGSRYFILDYVSVVRQILEELSYKRVFLLGHSLGAAILSLVAGCDMGIEKSCFIEGLGPLSSEDDQTVAQFEKHYQAYKKKSSLRAYTSLDQAVKRRAEQGRVSIEAAKMLAIRGLKKNDDHYFWSSDPKLLQPSICRLNELQIESFLKNINHEVLLIRGKSGLNWQFLEERINILKNKKVVMINGGHHVHMEAPQELAEAISCFFKN